MVSKNMVTSRLCLVCIRLWDFIYVVHKCFLRLLRSIALLRYEGLKYRLCHGHDISPTYKIYVLYWLMLILCLYEDYGYEYVVVSYAYDL